MPNLSRATLQTHRLGTMFPKVRLPGSVKCSRTMFAVGPFVDCLADQFGSVVDNDGLRQPSRLHETFHNAYDACGRQRRIDLDGRAFPAEVGDYIEVRNRGPLDNTLYI